MNTESTSPHNFISLGEALVDFISDDLANSLEQAAHFQRYAGGQPINLAANMARLGLRTAAGTCLGDDGLGRFLVKEMKRSGIDDQFVQVTTKAPTTCVVVNRQTSTPEFIIYRGADAHFSPDHSLSEAVKNALVVHTSAFALSRQPARDTILELLRTAWEAGVTVSLDPNYHPRVWPDTSAYEQVVQSAFQYTHITKPSIEDCERLFGSGKSLFQYSAQFMDWGANIVVITAGSQGVYLFQKNQPHYHLPARKVNVQDVTGAGDAFWSGFLAAIIHNGKKAATSNLPIDALCAGQAIAEYKIQTVGPLQAMPPWKTIMLEAHKLKDQIVVINDPT